MDLIMNKKYKFKKKETSIFINIWNLFQNLLILSFKKKKKMKFNKFNNPLSFSFL